MRTRGVWLLILFRAVLVITIQCPTDYRPYTCSSTACSCLLVSTDTVSTDTEADFPSASTNCLLALIEEDYDRQIIQRYIEVLAADSGDLYWVGYRYDGSLDVVDVNGQPASSVLTNSINFDPSTQDPSPGLCIAIGGDGLFWNLPCTDPQPYVCSVDFTAPGVSASSNPVRFVPSGDPVTLSCAVSGNAISKTVWFRNDVEITGAGSGFNLSNDTGVLTLDIGQFESLFEGDYHCLVENPFGTALSQVLRLEEGVDSPETSPIINEFTVNTTDRTIALGDPIALTCEADMAVTFSWLRNGEVLTQSTDSVVITNEVGTTSMLQVLRFQEGGIYQCRVETSAGYHAIGSIALGVTDGTPGPIDSLFASPRSQSEVTVGWLVPLVPNTQDLLLLRYRVLYSTDAFALDSSTPLLLPSADNSPAERTTLRDLDAGTKYTVSLVASSLAAEGMLSQFRASVTTYGTVPTVQVEISSVERTPDNRTLVVVWEEVVTSLPTGDIATYEIEYRDAGQITPNSGVVPGSSNFFTLSGLANANDYEVRVRACVEIRSDPVFSCTEWSDYFAVEGITTNIPPTGVVRKDDDVGVIVPAVVVPVTVLIVVIVLVALYFCCLSKRSGKMEVSSGGRVRTESNVGLTSSRDGDSEKPPLSVTSAV